MSNHIMNTYARLPVAFSHGKGVWLWDLQGKRYLDTVAGIAVMNLGHSHPIITEVIQQQAARLMQVSNGFEIPEQDALADRLAALTGLEKCFFVSSGVEANETAFKIVRRYGHQRGIKNPAIVVMEKAFHGRTLAGLTASGSEKVREGFDPFVEGFMRCPFNNLPALQHLIESYSDIVAVMLEPVQGEGGVRVPDPGYLAAVRQLCDQHQLLMIVDEVQTGLARTGKLFAYQHEAILPDIVTLAKALGAGYPVSVCIARGAAAEVLQVGKHGTTLGGNPLACRIALTVLDIMLQERLSERAAEMGDYLQVQLRKVLSGCPKVVNIRGKGLMVGVELSENAMGLRQKALELNEPGLVLNVTSDTVIRLLPPLVIEKPDIDVLVMKLAQII